MRKTTFSESTRLEVIFRIWLHDGDLEAGVYVTERQFVC